jgi:CelD/BcsL family acetyltransferase involved in cellulose biosynthesis
MESHLSGGVDGALALALLTDVRDLEACRGEWDALLSASATDTPMLSPLWLLAWWRTFGNTEGRQLKAWTFRVNGRLVGLVPLLLRRHRLFGVLPIRRLEMLGSGEREQDEIMSEYLSPIIAKGYDQAVVDALVEELALDEHGWHEISLSAMDGNAPAVAALESALRRQGWTCQVETKTKCPFIKLPSRWEDYLSGLHSSDRYFVKRSLRDFLAWAGDDWRVERVSSQADLPRGREVLVQLHQQRWQKDDKPSVFSSPLFLGFHDQVLPQLLAQNALDLSWLSVRDCPVAVNYNIVWRNRIYFYQGGRAVDVPKGIRPGIVLHLEAIKRAIQEGREEYDFLGGPARYKMQLASTTRPLVRWHIQRPSLAGLGYRLLQGGRAFLREARRRQAAASVAGSKPPVTGKAGSR